MRVLSTFATLASFVGIVSGYGKGKGTICVIAVNEFRASQEGVVELLPELRVGERKMPIECAYDF